MDFALAGKTVAETLKTASGFTWDFPYRFLASIGAATTGICWWTKQADRPLNVLAQACNWAGFDVTAHANEVNKWLTAPSRRNIIAVTAALILAFSLMAIFFSADSYQRPGTTRSAATFLLAGTILAQLNGPPDLLNWSNLFFFWTPLSISLVLSIKYQWRWHLILGNMILDLIFAAIYAVSSPLSWSTDRPG